MSVPYTPFSGSLNFPGSVTDAPAAPAASLPPNAILVPVSTQPNQSFTTTLMVDGQNRSFGFFLSYNLQAKYWIMSLTDEATGKLVLDSVPLLCGAFPAGNILEQYAYLGIGSAYIVPTGNPPTDFPDDLSLGQSFFLIWSDTPGYTG